MAVAWILRVIGCTATALCSGVMLCIGVMLSTKVVPCAEAMLAASAPAVDTADARTVAVTFDDLPATHAGGLPRLRRVTSQLLAHIEAARIPAIGFVNEGKLAVAGEEAERTALLQHWLDAGLELGNHTYSHADFYVTPLAAFQSDVLQGEVVTRRLLAAQGKQPRYFRHPLLNTGPDLASKRAFERFLSTHGYAIAPVTIDNDEWIYAKAYIMDAAAADSELRQRIGQDYIRHMSETFAFHEELSQQLLQREPAQILLLHANALNAEWFDELVTMMQTRGYGFVSLETALRDPAYDQPDDYVGRLGPSWLQRWAVTQGKALRSAPSAPQWVHDLAGQ